MKRDLAIPALGSLALAMGLVVASAAEPPAVGMASQPPAQFWMHHPGHGGMRPGMRRAMHGPMMGPRGAAIRDMLALEHLYRDVLARSQDPLLRNFAYARLARAELAPRNTGAAILTLRQALDENLKAVAARPVSRTPVRR